MSGERQQVRAGVSGLPSMGLEICNTFQLNDLCRPYRAFCVLARFTQGVALGCHLGAPLVLAKWGQSSLLTVGGHGRAGSPRCRGVGTKWGQSSLLTVGRHGVGAAAGSGGGIWFAGHGFRNLQYVPVKRFMSPLQGFLRSCPVYPGRCPGLSSWRTVGACKMGSVLTIDSWRAWQSRKSPVSRCWREKGSVLTIDSWEAWRGEQQKVRAGAPLAPGSGAVLTLLTGGSWREHAPTGPGDSGFPQLPEVLLKNPIRTDFSHAGILSKTHPCA